MLSVLANKINDSPTLALAQLTRKYKEEGKDIVDLWTGHLDYEPPQELLDAIKENLSTKNIAKYIPVAWLPALRTHIANRAESFYKKSISQENILVWSWAKTIIYTALLTIINPGDEVIVITPYWPSYIEQIKLVWWVPIVVKSNNECHIDIESIKTHITAKTKCIITNSPNNPSGVVYTKDEWLDLLNHIQWKPIFLLSDEMYKDFAFDKNFISPLMIADENMTKQIIVVDGLSKNLAIPWWRVWRVIADAAIIKAISKIQSNMTWNATSLVQHGLVTFFEKDNRWFVDTMRTKLSTTHDVIVNMLDESHIDYINPRWSLYFFINIGQSDSLSFCQDLLTTWGVSAVPWYYFGKEWYIRICYAMDQDIVEEGLRRLISFLKN